MLMAYLFTGTHNVLALLGISFVILFALTFSQATTPRYRIDQGVKWYILFFIIALIELIRVVYFVYA